MRVLVLGGTRFIGRRVVERLHDRGDDVLVAHRGESEPTDLPACAHLHADRAALAARSRDVAGFRPDAVVDTFALTGADVTAVLPALPDVPVVVLSSQDVYRAFEGVQQDRLLWPDPVTERSELRHDRYPYAGSGSDLDSYSKLDVEDAYRPRRATVLRLPMVYGPHDAQRREDPVLRRVRAGRTALPVGAGTLRWSRAHVDDVALAVLAALDTSAAVGEVVNIAEPTAPTMAEWHQQVLTAAGSAAALVRVPDDVVPGDLALTKAIPQDVVVDPARARELLGWQAADPADRVAESVRWHLRHPPAEPWSDADTAADDAALAAAVRLRGSWVDSTPQGCERRTR